jgi:hypothetical protein
MRELKGKQADQLVNDPRFGPTLTEFFDNVRLPFINEAASDGLLEYFGPPNDVAVTEGRYVSASACAPQFCQEKILLWADTDQNSPVLIAAVVCLSRAEARGGKQLPHLWILSSYSGKMLPSPFVASLDGWLTEEVYPALRDNAELANGGIKAATLIVAPSGKNQILDPNTIKMPPF